MSVMAQVEQKVREIVSGLLDALAHEHADLVERVTLLEDRVSALEDRVSPPTAKPVAKTTAARAATGRGSSGA